MRRVRAGFIIGLGCWFGVGIAHAGRPLVIDDADPADPGQGEVEAGVGYVQESECKHWDFPFGLSYGVIPTVEVGVGFGLQRERRTEMREELGGEECVGEEGVGDLGVGAKWQFLGESTWCPRQALAPSVKFPTADEDEGLGSGETDYDVTWIASKAVTDAVGIHVNIGYTWIGSPQGEDGDDVVHYGVALDGQIQKQIQGVGEFSADREAFDGAKTFWAANAGLRWAVTDTLTVDGAIGTGLNEDTPDFTATIGVTWAWDLTGKNSNGEM